MLKPLPKYQCVISINYYAVIEKMTGLFAAQSGIKEEMAQKVEKLKNMSSEEVRDLLHQTKVEETP